MHRGKWADHMVLRVEGDQNIFNQIVQVKRAHSVHFGFHYFGVASGSHIEIDRAASDFGQGHTVGLIAQGCAQRSIDQHACIHGAG